VPPDGELMRQSTFDRWLLGAGALIALLIVAIVLTFLNTRRLNEDAARVARSYQVMATLEEVHGHMREAEAVQRTHLIMGGDDIPPTFAANIKAARQQVETAKELTADNREQLTRIPDIARRIEALGQFWTSTMSVRKEQGFDAAKQIVVSGQSRRMMAELQSQLERMKDTERMLLRDRSRQREATYRLALTTGLMSGVAAITGVSAFMVLLRRHMTARSTAAGILAEQGERLRTTLASIGDAVITTDMEGRITNINPVGESLTGWMKEEAIGQPLDVVFRVLNEETREPVANPVSKALAEGVVVGLANHTVLIAKNGAERPIDDSAAPIRCKDGEVVGCVLVFRDIAQRRRLERENSSRLVAARLLSSPRRMRLSARLSTASFRVGMPPPSDCSASPPSRRLVAIFRSSFPPIASRKKTRSSPA
jgi:PAS domain S-box-containing protein